MQMDNFGLVQLTFVDLITSSLFLDQCTTLKNAQATTTWQVAIEYAL